MPKRILIVDDDQNLCKMIEAFLRTQGFEPSWYTSAEPAFAALRTGEFDAVITDLNMPGMNGVELCERTVANRPDVPVVVMTAFGSLETAVAALRAGAYDFVTKPVEMDVLAFVVQRAVKHRSLQQEVKKLSEIVEKSARCEGLIGESAPMQQLFDRIRRVADSEVSVLICGESGTGKELVAKALHAQSRRHGGPFVGVNCAAIPESLLESELFGHKRGAFTDAKSDRKGLFLQASGGILFLDEISAFPLSLQPKLLRALEERRLRPVGADQEVPFDARVIAATNRDLEAAVEEERFREDLFFRINVVQIELPPLRSRGTDSLLLGQHFLAQFAGQSGKRVTGISHAVADKLLGYAWPGNVRELRNAIEHAVALTRYEEITVEDLPEKIRAYRGSHVLVGGDDPTELVPMEEVERRYILHVMQAVGGNKTLAARVLGLDRKTLHRKLHLYGAAESNDRPS
jgi:two-component system response regulator HydG